MVGWILLGGPDAALADVAAHHSPPSAGEPVLESDHHSPGPAGDPDYSLMMHHTSGWAVLLVAGLVFADRMSPNRHRVLAIGIGCVWLFLGGFLFVQANREGWPLGEEGVLESFTMPTSGEWLQHKLLSLIPILIGVYWLGLQRLPAVHGKYHIGMAVLAVLGVIGLMSHQHLDHPGHDDIVNLQHRGFAVTGLVIAASHVQEAFPQWNWKGKQLMFPIALLLLGMQLIVYTE